MKYDERLCDLAIARLKSHPDEPLSFVALIDEAGCSKATAYKAYPHGARSVLDAVHRRSATDVILAIEEATAHLKGRTSYENVVRTAVKAALRACETSCLIQALRSNTDVLTSYLLAREEASVVSIVGRYVAKCAAIYDTSDGFDLNETRRKSEAFVFGVLCDLLATVPERPTKRWPLWKHAEPHLNARITQFMLELGLPAEMQKDSAVVPLVDSLRPTYGTLLSRLA